MNPDRRIQIFGARMATVAIAAALLTPAYVAGQGAVDPTVGSRAAAMERTGDWDGAIEMLGRYLATAPADGQAWFQFGRMYLIGSRSWHDNSHQGSPDGPLYLDLAALALERASELRVDSGLVFRGLVVMDHGLTYMEEHGWAATRMARGGGSVAGSGPTLPGFITELGANLLESCSDGAVLVTNNELEALAVWFASVESGRRPEVFPLIPTRYAADHRYRQAVTRSLELPDDLPGPELLGRVAANRPLCLTPLTDTLLLPGAGWQATRLVMTTGAVTEDPAGVLSVTELIRAQRQHPTPWTVEVQAIYAEAARRNLLLCNGLLAFLTDGPPDACGQ